MQWLLGGKKKQAAARAQGTLAKRRYLGARAARVTQRMCLVHLHRYLQESMTLREGVAVLAPHEAYTTNTCVVCHEYAKGARFVQRYRLCPNEECATRAEGEGGKDYLFHRELNSGLNCFVAAWCQLRALGKVGELPRRLQ